jgi:CubicO group peptidase (beta-lactamase class C family)
MLFFLRILFFSQIVILGISINVFGQIQPEFNSILNKIKCENSLDKNIFTSRNISGTIQLDSAIDDIMQTHHIPGMAACILKDSQLVWVGTYGYASLEENIEVADSTVFMIGSISKTIVAAAAMQLWENGLLDLDANINDYLPFDVINPYYSGSAITTRMLLAHMSSLARNDQVWFDLVNWGADSPILLGDFLEDYLVPGGQYYNPSNYLIYPPGHYLQYCNYAFGLIGYMIEVITEMPFEQYCQDSIFIPLGMDETSWFLPALNENNIAIPYDWTGYNHIPYAHYGTPIYPCGQLRTSLIHLADFLMSFMFYGEIHGSRILDSTTVELMKTIQYPGVSSGSAEVGIAWIKYEYNDSTTLWGHDGVMWGYQSAMYFDPDRNTAVIVLINLFEIGDPGFGYLLQTLLDFSWDYDEDGVIAGLDNCPGVYNPEQTNDDTDSLGNACDNCPGVYNPDQIDVNFNDIGDVCEFVCGDVNNDDVVNIKDITYLIKFKYKSGVAPVPNDCVGDVNGDFLVNIKDITDLIKYKYKGGNAPAENCCQL